jgi:hypothetical protein
MQQTLTPQAKIDRIIYLCQLASVPAKVDVLMNTLRTITARWDGGAPLPVEDINKLEQLETDLRHYLIYYDPLRKFTPESLEQRVANAEAGTRPANGARLSFFMILLGAVSAGTITFLIGSLVLPITMSVLLISPMFFLVLCLGSAWLYWSALSNFASEFRKAHVYLCSAIVLFVPMFLNFFVVQLFQLGRLPFFKFFAMPWVIFAVFFMMYLGMRTYIRLVGVHVRYASLKVFGVVAVILSALVVLYPHSSRVLPGEEPYYYISLIGMTFTMLAIIFAAILAGKIKRAVTIPYAKSLYWLHIYLLLCSVTGVACVGCLLLLGEVQGPAMNWLITLGGVPPQILLLYTGYLFKKETGV